MLDMSTSVIARGRLAEWLDRGEEIGPDWLTPGGAIRPSGGYKGTGLALVAEALADLTGSGSVSAAPESDAQGVFCIAIDVARLRPLHDFADEMERMLAYVRDTPLEDGHDAIRFPGESGATAAAERLRDGVPVQQFTWDPLRFWPPTWASRCRSGSATSSTILPNRAGIVHARERLAVGRAARRRRSPAASCRVRHARAARRTRAGSHRGAVDPELPAEDAADLDAACSPAVSPKLTSVPPSRSASSTPVQASPPAESSATSTPPPVSSRIARPLRVAPVGAADGAELDGSGRASPRSRSSRRRGRRARPRSGSRTCRRRRRPVTSTVEPSPHAAAGEQRRATS